MSPTLLVLVIVVVLLLGGGVGWGYHSGYQGPAAGGGLVGLVLLVLLILFLTGGLHLHG